MGDSFVFLVPFVRVDFLLCRYHLDMVKIYGPMKQSIQAFLDKNPEVETVLIGTRRTDPFGGNVIVDFIVSSLAL